MKSQAETFDFYKSDLLKLSRNKTGNERFFNGTIPPKSGWTRYCVVEYVCNAPKLDPMQMATALIHEGIKIYFDDSSISREENCRLERRVMKEVSYGPKL